MANDPSADVTRKVSRWFRATMSGCHFAGDAITNALINVHLRPVDVRASSTFCAHFSAAAQTQKLGVIILPEIDSEEGIVEMLKYLREHEHWGFTLPADPTGGLVVDLHWNKKNGPPSSVIGFAPLGSMPITRRSPFVLLATWPLGHDNPFRSKPAPHVGVGDMAHDLKKPAYDDLRRKTQDEMKIIRSMPSGNRPTQDVTFRLSERLLGSL